MQTLICAAAVSLASNSSFVPARATSGPEDPKRTAERFEALKDLAGEWHGADTDGNGKPDSRLVYRVTSAGSTVHATMFPGEAHEMINTVNVVDGEMYFTHFCAMGNQPRMRLVPSEDDNTWHFRFAGGTNIDTETDKYMGDLVIDVDGDKMTETWTTYESGQAIGTTTLEYTRASATPSEGETYFLVLLEHGPNRSQNDEEVSEIQRAHLENLRSLSEEGSLMIAGPFADRSGGVLVMKADSAEQARRIAEQDPAVQAGRLIVRVRPWWVPAGAVRHWADVSDPQAAAQAR